MVTLGASFKVLAITILSGCATSNQTARPLGEPSSTNLKTRVEISALEIPDPKFRQCLQGLQVKFADEVKVLDCRNLGITNTMGLQNFQNLQAADFSGNNFAPSRTRGLNGRFGDACLSSIDGNFISWYRPMPPSESGLSHPTTSCGKYQSNVNFQSYSTEDERRTYFATTPWSPDTQFIESREKMAQYVAVESNVQGRHISYRHYPYDESPRTGRITMHVKHQRMGDLAQDGEAFEKVWYLETRGPGFKEEFPRRIFPASSTAGCLQQNRECTPTLTWPEHTISIDPGHYGYFIWQAAEIDNFRPGEIDSIGDAAEEWYTNGAGGQVSLLTDIIGILFVSWDNEDDLLAASYTSFSHGAAFKMYELGYTSQQSSLRLTRTAMKQVNFTQTTVDLPTNDYMLQIECGYCGDFPGAPGQRVMKEYVLPAAKYGTRATVWTDVWFTLN